MHRADRRATTERALPTKREEKNEKNHIVKGGRKDKRTQTDPEREKSDAP